MPQHKAVFFDRDNTFIKDMVYLNDPEQVHYLPHAFEVFKTVQDAGFKIVVVTNQSGVPRGKVTLKNLELIHQRITREMKENRVDITAIYFAPYLDEHNHPWRKPGAGMLLQAAEDHDIDLAQSWMVGDKMIDVEAGHRAGCRSVLVWDFDSPANSKFDPPELHAASLVEAQEFILSQS